MTERDFARSVEHQIHLMGRRVLRVCDGYDGRGGMHGLRALTRPPSTALGRTTSCFLVWYLVGWITGFEYPLLDEELEP